MAVNLVALFGDLVRLETALWSRADDRLKEQHRLPLSWFEVMHLIDVTPGCRVLDVAETLIITVGGASKVVNKVEGEGWCRRIPNPDDGRSNLLMLTVRGTRVLRAARMTFDGILDDYLGAAAPVTELTQLSRSLGRIRRHLIETADAAGPVAS